MFRSSIHSGPRRMRHRDMRHDIRHGGDNHPDWFRRGPGRGRGQMRRGEIRPLILSTLSVRPMHGYEVIQELELQSGGRWRPERRLGLPDAAAALRRGPRHRERDRRPADLHPDRCRARGGRSIAGATGLVGRRIGPGARPSQARAPGGRRGHTGPAGGLTERKARGEPDPGRVATPDLSAARRRRNGRH